MSRLDEEIDMAYDNKFKGWSSLTKEDLLIAYRKAKADCFFENNFPTTIKFAEYEQDLLNNVEKLLKKLKSNFGFAHDDALLGEYRLLPKKISTEIKSDNSVKSHVHFSNPDRAVEDLFKNYNVTPEFRIVGDFPVETHIISALWINTIGHKFDAKLEESCYGARLKRLRQDDFFNIEDEKPFHISSIGSFVPYFQPYQKWRNDGLKTMRDELEKGRNIIAVSLDLKSYYHFIDPLALSNKTLLVELDLELDEQEKNFTAQLAKFLNNWSNNASNFGQKIGGNTESISGGLVIGLTCSRIISNVLLHKWDKLVMEKLSPVHYGRYVDDMFLVLRDTGNISNELDLMKMFQKSIGRNHFLQDSKDKSIWQIKQGKKIQSKTVISLQSNKQKLFILQGKAGLDLLDSIEKEIYELSSEHRLMPSPEQLEDSTAAKVLSAAGSVGENADTLRRADGLTIRRLSWSLQLRHVETLARDLPPSMWKSQREEFYQFAYNHILRTDKLFSHLNYLPRLLGFAITMNEWEHAERIAMKSYQSIDELSSKIGKNKLVIINGCKANIQKNFWGYVKGTLTWLFIDAATRYHNLDKFERSAKKKRLANLFIKQIVTNLSSFEELLDLHFNLKDFESKVSMIAATDLAKEAYKYKLKDKFADKLICKHNNKMETRILTLLDQSDFLDADTFKQFFNSTRKTRLARVSNKQKKNESYLPYLFPTRPLSPAEISELAPECVGLPLASGKPTIDGPTVTWAKFTQVLRGVWIKPTLLATKLDSKDKPLKEKKKETNFLNIGTDRKNKIVVALTSFRTEDSDWATCASNKPNLSTKRYQRISNLVNDTLKLNPKPDYMIFPELSIPLSWVNSIANKLANSGISLIAGTEYRHTANNKILSEAVLILADNRLGYPTFVKIWQPKLEPAVGEDKELFSKYGKTWDKPKKLTKPVYIHNGFNFGLMVCSELQNSKARIGFQGAIDALIVLSWNRDLETFASLIESAALDIHAYTILVNNRKYGDSRVRSPAKESFLRDIARLRGGDNDFVVAATLDITALRSFQSRAKRWPEFGDKFKPVPEGFILRGGRKKLPPS